MKTHPEGVGDCPAVFPIPSESGHDYLCTRDEGHDGSHMASTSVEVVAVWDSELAWCTHRHQGELWFRREGRALWFEVPQ